MKVGIPKEIRAQEHRVAVVPEGVGTLRKAGMQILVECGAGEGASCPDRAYEEVGAAIVPDPIALLGQADVVLKVQKPVLNRALGRHEVELMQEGAVLIGILQPLSDPDLVKRLADRKVTSFSLDCIPRIARAQKMDALSSQGTVAGYVAALLAASSTGKFFPMLVTAAGTVPPAKVLVLGAGVAGLQAIATARRLGALVQGYDIRPAVKEQVESLGAAFLSLEIGEDTETAGGYAKELSQEAHRRELAFIAQHVKDADVVISTALIPGKRAPLLITAEAVEAMKPGSVIVDLAAEAGGNCALTQAGTRHVHHGVVILGPVNLSSRLPLHASQMYSRNISNFLLHLVRDGKLEFDFSDPITGEACVTHEGKVRRV